MYDWLLCVCMGQNYPELVFWSGECFSCITEQQDQVPVDQQSNEKTAQASLHDHQTQYQILKTSTTQAL